VSSALKEQVAAWKFNRDLATSLLKALSDRDLKFIAAPTMGTLGEQFRHVARVRAQYLDALRTKKVGPGTLKIDPAVSRSKKRLLAINQLLDKKLLSHLKKVSEADTRNMRINWSYWELPPMSIAQHIAALNEHEILHNGQLIVYMRALGKKFPAKWKVWGL
jgi:uncharacterized damage-inducible protein DinB